MTDFGNSKQGIAIVGAGLAGSEAAWQLAQAGQAVTLFEMRPQRMTPAHKTDGCAELVCSNSFKSRSVENAHGLLKAEMGLRGSLILEIAERHDLPFDRLDAMVDTVGLGELPALGEAILAGQVRGRIVVDVSG